MSTMIKVISRLIVFLSYVVITTSLWAAAPSVTEPAKSPVKPVLTDPISTGDLFQVLFGLIFVLASIAGIVWLLRRMGHASGAKNSQLKIVAVLNIGHREKVFVVQVGDKQLLIGVTPGSINTLHVLEENLSAPETPQVFASALAEKLKGVMNKKGDQ